MSALSCLLHRRTFTPTALVMPLAQRHREAAHGHLAGLSALDLREFHEHRLQRRRRTKLRQR
eukprot:5144085-Alexandrium_andersonii.AAC.1